jgi:hypothetical protein
MSSDLRAFVDRVVVPALLERFLWEQAAAAVVAAQADLPKIEATV